MKENVFVLNKCLIDQITQSYTIVDGNIQAYLHNLENFNGMFWPYLFFEGCDKLNFSSSMGWRNLQKKEKPAKRFAYN